MSKQQEMKKHFGRYTLVLVQTGFWAINALIVFSVASAVFPSGLAFFLTVENLFFAAIAVYVNYLFFLPPLLKHKNYGNYAFKLCVLVAGILAARYGVDQFVGDVGFRQKMVWRAAAFRGLTYFILIGLSSLLKFIVEWLKSQEAGRHLEKEKLSAELDFLKSQINPHFLFNTLNNIYVLALLKDDLAAPSVSKLSEMLRYMLYETGSKRVSLQKEADLIQNYIALKMLKIEEGGFKPDLKLSGSFSSAKIAPLILINFVENAFKYGDWETSPQARIEVLIEAQNGFVLFSIKNTFSQDKKKTETDDYGGIGISNALRQLDLNYPGAYEIRYGETSPGFFEVVLKMWE